MVKKLFLLPKITFFRVVSIKKLFLPFILGLEVELVVNVGLVRLFGIVTEAAGVVGDEVSGDGVDCLGRVVGCVVVLVEVVVGVVIDVVVEEVLAGLVFDLRS